VLINFYGFNDDKNPKWLPTKYTLIVENLKDNVLVNTEEGDKEAIVEWVTHFIYEMINATNTTDGSWQVTFMPLYWARCSKLDLSLLVTTGRDWAELILIRLFLMTSFQDF
jgi:hypothetical protein